MTKEQIKTLNELLADPSFQVKKPLKHLLWLNTVKPQFNIGDSVEINLEGYRYVSGEPIRTAVGVVKEISKIIHEETYRYYVECVFDEGDGKTYTTLINCAEKELKLANL